MNPTDKDSRRPITSEQIGKWLDSMSDEEAELGQRIQQEETAQEYAAFKAAYHQGVCYLCDEPFERMRSDRPCTHWLLRRAKFKKNDFAKIWDVYDYHSTAAFLRWCANEEHPLRNINDLASEKGNRKVISYTVKWKDIEWTFDCSSSDLAGHGKGFSSFPHYHFQMRIDGRQFINFNDFHVPFSEKDLFMIAANELPTVRADFGPAGAGMQDAVEADLDFVIDETEPTEDPNAATYDLSTIIVADDKPLSGHEFLKIIQEAKKKNRTVASVARERLKDKASVTTIVSPAESIPAIAVRTENKPR
ncbi:hypothetical protein GTP38_24875 [Duganella sp. FT94W]|uniref:Uncharacterized protein n=1 Tax=Duganella lactea TaxID=2692173 RepID=A0ABW9VD55_9BURK|nr:hypothetical protein [Duganella lactea]MYM37564.1 hypothetical protein [Duganella lactea]